MDCFSSLPPEINVMILLHLRTRSNIKPLLSASPKILQHYRESKEDIQRAHLQAEPPGGLLQDALVVAKFPLKNPYIEDYITKATSTYPSRAYLCMPSPYSNVDQLQFRGQPIGIDILRVDALRDVERKRLFRAFLRYELVSKIHYLEDSLELKVIDKLVALAFKRSPETVTETGKFIPDNGLRSPDSMWFSSNAYIKDAFIDGLNTEELAFLGFDLMTRLLNAPRDDRGCPMGLMEWLAKIPMRLRQKGWTLGLRMDYLFGDEIFNDEPNHRRGEEWSEIGQTLTSPLSVVIAIYSGKSTDKEGMDIAG
ncbi:hypothetical protein IWW34DRAFT_880120 [Fusarium oxysporum f. sp. albedinis]|nr:hypothetical protein IWW34DRAFT_880120 [Fusarium oxysporum f. sp. albedinis]